jgi:p-hydroxybenzoate 3-monooxygenase
VVRVAIVGAGPAGLFAANALTRAGIECLVFERLDEGGVRARARAGVIEARTASLLERHGLAGGIYTRGKTLEAWEFRRRGQSHVFNYAALSGARNHVYPQQLLVGDMIDSLRTVGGEIRFQAPVTEIRLEGGPAVVCADGSSVTCDFVLGCDGYHGIARRSATGTVCSAVDFGADWLTVLAEAPPSSERLIFGLHPDGFAGHMRRTATVTRFYLQVEPGTEPDEYDDEHIWTQLDARLAADGEVLRRGPIVEKSILELRSAVTQPMQAGPLFLAGDAAHIVTPAGAKGMNLALQDVAELVEGLIEFYRRGDRGRLDGYSVTRLPKVWRMVEFSHWMLQLLLSQGRGTSEREFLEGLREANLARLLEHGLFARDFAVAYVGIDP